MRRVRLVFFIFFAIACVSSAAILFLAFPLFQSPRVVALEPANDAQEIPPTSPITITFSAPMNQYATLDAIRFTPRVNGTFAWTNNQTLTFTPRAALPISKTIAIEIHDARSWLGFPMEQTAQSRFTTVSYPHVVDSSPALDAQFIYIPTHVALTFNRALNSNSVYNNLTITPTLANQTLFVDANTVTLGGFFQPRTRYEIRLAAKAFDDEYAIPLEHDVVWNFTTAEQYTNLSILQSERVMHFSAQNNVSIPLQFTNVSRLDVALYSISPEQFDANANAPFETWYAFQPTTAPIQTQRVATNAVLDEYTTRNVSLDTLPTGNYFLAVTSPEGVSDAKLLRVQ